MRAPSATSTRSTSADGGPSSRRSTRRSRSSRGPSATTRTDPSASFATNPSRSRCMPSRSAQTRKPTPWTRPRTLASRRAAVAGSGAVVVRVAHAAARIRGQRRMTTSRTSSGLTLASTSSRRADEPCERGRSGARRGAPARPPPAPRAARRRERRPSPRAGRARGRGPGPATRRAAAPARGAAPRRTPWRPARQACRPARRRHGGSGGVGGLRRGGLRRGRPASPAARAAGAAAATGPAAGASSAASAPARADQVLRGEQPRSGARPQQVEQRPAELVADRLGLRAPWRRRRPGPARPPASRARRAAVGASARARSSSSASMSRAPERAEPDPGAARADRGQQPLLVVGARGSASCRRAAPRAS